MLSDMGDSLRITSFLLVLTTVNVPLTRVMPVRKNINPYTEIRSHTQDSCQYECSLRLGGQILSWIQYAVLARSENVFGCWPREPWIAGVGYCANDVPAVADQFNSADDFLHRIKINSNHILQLHPPDKTDVKHVLQLHPPHKTDIPYQLRTCSHSMSPINKIKSLSDTDFFILMLYKYLH